MNTKRQDHFEKHVGTEAFTKAHEVGHWDLHIAVGGAIQPMLPLFSEAPQNLCRTGSTDRREIQAEKYAACLLMPSHLVMAGIDGINFWDWPTLYALKKSFGVTITALTKRFTELGLIFIADKTIFRSEQDYHGAKRLF